MPTLLAEASADAPRSCGVYLMFNSRGKLIYVGKATDLKRRLSEHARAASPDARMRRMSRAVRDVRWLITETEEEALCLEAELVMALQPHYNHAIVGEEPCFVEIATGTARNGRCRVQIDLSETPSGAGRAHGAITHLGKGRLSWPSVRSKEGHSGLLRLLWVSFNSGADRFRMPSRLAPVSPPRHHTMRAGEEMLEPLHMFLAGRDRSLVDTCTQAVMDDETPAYMLGPLLRDLEAADTYFRIALAPGHRRRERHRLGEEPIATDDLFELIVSETEGSLGMKLSS